MNTQWGPEIQHDGKGRPEGLDDQDRLLIRTHAPKPTGLDPSTYRVGDVQHWEWWNRWDDIQGFRLRADHPLYQKPKPDAWVPCERTRRETVEECIAALGAIPSTEAVTGKHRSDGFFQIYTIQKNICLASAVEALRDLLKPADPDEGIALAIRDHLKKGSPALMVVGSDLTSVGIDGEINLVEIVQIVRRELERVKG